MYGFVLSKKTGEVENEDTKRRKEATKLSNKTKNTTSFGVYVCDKVEKMRDQERKKKKTSKRANKMMIVNKTVETKRIPLFYFHTF